MKAQLTHIEPMQLLGIQEKGPSSFNDEMNSGAQFGDSMWQKFIPLLISQGIDTHRRMYGVSWPADDLTPPQEINYFVGIEGDSEIDSTKLTSFTLEGGNYFTYEYVGSPEDIDKGFADAYMTALPASTFTPREGQHLEIYPDDFDPNAAEISFRILIPIE